MPRRRALNERIQRCQRRIELRERDAVKAKSQLKDAIAFVRSTWQSLQSERAELASLRAKTTKIKENGLKRDFLRPDGLSQIRHHRFRQLLKWEYESAGADTPKWIDEISAEDVANIKTATLIERYAQGDGKLSGLIDPNAMRAAVKRIKSQMAVLMGGGEASEELNDLNAVLAGWDPALAAKEVADWRIEAGVTAEYAVTISRRNLLATTSFCCAKIDGDWLDDLALRLVARLRQSDVRPEPAEGKAASAIEISVGRKKERSLARVENDIRLMEAVAVFATPGAMAAGYWQGLSADERKYCATWFGANRDLVMRLGARVGSTATFRKLKGREADFRLHYGATSKIEPRIWAREGEIVALQAETPTQLVEEARHALVDLSLRSHLVSLPKDRTRFIELGAWTGNETIHQDGFDVAKLATKSFLSEARDAAEVQVMQGTNPLAMTVGLVSWKSADGAERQAPLFLAMAEFDEAAKTIRRVSDFTLNGALLRRIAIEFPALAGTDDGFESLSHEIAFRTPVGDVFTKVVAAVNGRAPQSEKAILKVDDGCLIGSFDSSRSVLERRLNLQVFPRLVENPVVVMLAQGAKHEIIYGEFDAGKARSRPDDSQAVAVKACLGGTSFILEGPPGTGKTQTIAAMVEALSGQGKRILVSAAMPGAVEVVGRRLSGATAFKSCAMRSGQIYAGATGLQADPQSEEANVVIGTPMALTKELPSDEKFDVLIVDEASQLRLSHALTLCGHVKQIIVAGDSRQLQPRDADVGDVSEASLLARARLAGFPTIMLENHYRSQHHSLIGWSNLFSYELKLKPNMGPLLLGDAGFAVSYLGKARRVQRDGLQINVEEAEAIATECVRWAKDGRRTVGVAALTQGQRDLIRETVERELGKAGLSAASKGPDNKFFSATEPFFIRTAGAVQGEERDVMIVSLGVAPNAQGKISQNLGALSRPDGLAVANVMLSRARLRTVVYSSIAPREINLASMTAGMFLIASILRIGTVVGSLELIGDNLFSNVTTEKWRAHKLIVDGEEVYGIIHPQFADRYAVALAFSDKNPMRFTAEERYTPAAKKLDDWGWKVLIENDRLRRSSDPEGTARYLTRRIENMLM